MRGLLFIILLILVGANVVFFAASGMQSQAWAKDACHLSGALCEHPMWLAAATAAIAAVYLATSSRS